MMEMFLGVLIGLVVGIILSFFGVVIFETVGKIVAYLITGAKFLERNRRKWKKE